MPMRRALLISNPGEKGADNYCGGVNIDMLNYAMYLKSSLGGLWAFNEIEQLDRPSTNEVRIAVQRLKAYDYAKIIYCGHGWYDAARKSTILELRNKEYIDSTELKQGSRKQTVILDCCREVQAIALFEDLKAAIAKAERSLNAAECRKLYDQRIESCSSALVMMYGCAIGETAGDDSQRGGYYSFSLLKSADSWSQSIHNSREILSVVGAHDKAVPRIQSLSGGRQNPQIEKPRADRYFPFAVVA